MSDSGVPRAGTEALRARLSWHVIALFLVGCLSLFSRFFRAHTLGFFEDDFFYYVQVARNLALHGLSSFNGTTLTNGYHPLWLLTLVALFRLAPGMDFFIAVQSLSLLLAILFFFAASRCLQHLHLDAPSRPLAALLLSLHALLLVRYGMEVTLALPLGMILLAYRLSPSFQWRNRQVLLYGLLASLTVLARLDSALLIVLLLGAQTLVPDPPGTSWRTRLCRLLVFTLGCTPLFLYLFLNQRWFHILLPISGRAKQLKPFFPPSLIPIESLFLPHDRMKAAFVLPALILLAAGLAYFGYLHRKLAVRERTVLAALLLFPFLHFGALAWLSDWPVWPWYFYSLSFSSLGCLAILLRSDVPLGMAHLRVPALRLGAAAYAVYLCAYAFLKVPAPLASLAAEVADFAAHHPGTYAMGDGAGTPSFLSNQPFVHLEGLMMDRSYLTEVEHRTPLAQVLQRHHVLYYVLLEAPTKPGCFPVSEPGQAGPRSPHMAATICDPPAARFEHDGLSLSIFNASSVR